MEPNFQNSHKSKCIVVKELLDIAVPPSQKNVALRTLFQTIVEELGIQYAETNVSRVEEYTPKLDLNVQEVIADISKTLDHAIRGWVKNNRYTYSCHELAEFLRNHGFPKYAEYLENCMNDKFKDDESGDEIVPLLWKSTSSKNADNNVLPYCPTNTESNKFTEGLTENPGLRKRGTSLSIYRSIFQAWIQHPVASFFLVSFGFVIGLLPGLGISFLLNTKDCPINPQLSGALNNSTFTTAPISTTIQTPQTSTELPIAATSPTYCKPEDDHQNFTNSQLQYLPKILPDWSQKTLNLCNTTDILLVVVTGNMAKFYGPEDPLPEILCPDRVVGIEFVSQIYWRFVQHFLRKLCRLRQVSFVGMGEDECSTDSGGVAPYPNAPIASSSISYLHIQGFSRCKALYLELPKAGLNLDKVVRISFKCVEFDDRNPVPLQNLIDFFPKLETVNCLNNNNCVAFNAHVGRGISLISGYVPCSRGLEK